MPRINITREWLTNELSRLARATRKYASTTDVSGYWARVTAAVELSANEAQDLQTQTRKILQGLLTIEEDLDAKS